MTKVLVALSGGVDSATAAVILKQKGYNVIGAIMVFEGVSCETVGKARSVAQHIGIPFHVFDITETFSKRIIGNFVAEYERGKTPNPCILCNQHIKFGLFLKRAQELGINKLATGHYARIEKKRGKYYLKKGVDRNEQSYFLYRLNQKQLSHTILPLGSCTKTKVREIAHKNKLPVAERKKSQDICFIPDGNYVAYLNDTLPQKQGLILDLQGKAIGEHKGTMFYTYGQRRGIGIYDKNPYYVVRIDAKRNVIYVGRRKDVYSSQMFVRGVTLISLKKLDNTLKVQAKVRYVSRLSRATVKPLKGNRAMVVFRQQQWAPTPGQSIVFYQGDVVLGGGIIEKVFFRKKS